MADDADFNGLGDDDAPAEAISHSPNDKEAVTDPTEKLSTGPGDGPQAEGEDPQAEKEGNNPSVDDSEGNDLEKANDAPSNDDDPDDPPDNTNDDGDCPEDAENDCPETEDAEDDCPENVSDCDAADSVGNIEPAFQYGGIEPPDDIESVDETNIQNGVTPPPSEEVSQSAEGDDDDADVGSADDVPLERETIVGESSQDETNSAGDKFPESEETGKVEENEEEEEARLLGDDNEDEPAQMNEGTRGSTGDDGDNDDKTEDSADLNEEQTITEDAEKSADEEPMEGMEQDTEENNEEVMDTDNADGVELSQEKSSVDEEMNDIITAIDDNEESYKVDTETEKATENESNKDGTESERPTETEEKMETDSTGDTETKDEESQESPKEEAEADQKSITEEITDEKKSPDVQPDGENDDSTLGVLSIESVASLNEENKDDEKANKEDADKSKDESSGDVAKDISENNSEDTAAKDTSIETVENDMGIQISAVQSGADLEDEETGESANLDTSLDKDKTKEDKEKTEVSVKIKKEPGEATQKTEVTADGDAKDDKMDSKEKVKETLANIKKPPDEDVKPDVKSRTTRPTPKPKGQAKGPQKCIVCGKAGKCKYNIVRNGDVKHLCDDTCFKTFRANPTAYLASNKQPPSSNVSKTPSKCCLICNTPDTDGTKKFLSWQGMSFCQEECLGKYQSKMSTSCAFCSTQIQQANSAKFCLKVGDVVKQFCSSVCHDQFKSSQKLCAFCEKNLIGNPNSFMAPTGQKGEFHDFCSQDCLKNYEDKSSSDIEIIGSKPASGNIPNSGSGMKTRAKTGSLPQKCAVCSKTAPVKHEINYEGKMNKLCSDPCFAAFRYANKLSLNSCTNCGTDCNKAGTATQYIQYEGQSKRFCSSMCLGIFKAVNKKSVPCSWCRVQKSNFDMIERVDANNKYQLFCSLNCLSLYRVNIQATSNQSVTCDQCKKAAPAQYHLTMSDASVRNFCSYNCVMGFQSQFQAPQRITAASQRVNTNNKGTTSVGGIPVISNVMSLANQQQQRATSTRQPQVNRQVTSQATTPKQNVVTKAVTPPQAPKTTTTASQAIVRQKIIIQPPPPKQVKNKSLLCKPFTQTKATSCRPHTQSKETQTEEEEKKQAIIPVPVPIYIPTPMAMYSYPTPYPIPIPIPIPVPCFIPTTKKSANSILKHIKEIQERMPADPFEAELLMMAEAVAVAQKMSDDESDDDDADKPEEPSNGAAESGQSGQQDAFGEDMLQMAIRMASEMTEPVMDLEDSLAPVPVQANTPAPAPAEEFSTIDSTELITPPKSKRGRRGGARRGGRGKKPAKPVAPEPPPEPVVEQAPPPDANMHLKYTYGVNAWKHWVVQKNASMEKPSGRGKVKLFRTDLLQCTADELNFSLCLFVKEVRKPNGEEYAPDSIYYLCLGIQQYLFENGRIDNIFTDFYYERFTECLHEVVSKYQVRLNSAGLLVCRIEEEHLWECKQLGAHSPYVLLNTLVYFNTKYFMLKSPEDHGKLSFSHIMKHWKKTNIPGSKTPGRSVYLRFYAPVPTIKGQDPSVKRKREETPVYEQAENLENPLRCPVKLYEFYLSKCPESIKNRNDVFYLTPERSCVPDSPVWYSTAALPIENMAKMVNRVAMVREVQEANLTVQPIYV